MCIYVYVYVYVIIIYIYRCVYIYIYILYIMYMSDDDAQNSNIDCTKDHILDLDGISNIRWSYWVQPFNPKGAGVSGWISFEPLHNEPNYGFLRFWTSEKQRLVNVPIFHITQILEISSPTNTWKWCEMKPQNGTCTKPWKKQRQTHCCSNVLSPTC